MKFVLLLVTTILLVPDVYAANKPIADNYVAVFDLDTQDVGKGLSKPLTDAIRTEMVKAGDYKIIDRSNMDKILGEQKFQYSGCVSGTCVVELGQLLGVGRIITGSVGKIGKTYNISLQLVNVRTGEIEKTETQKCKCEEDMLFDASTVAVQKLLGKNVSKSDVAKLENGTSQTSIAPQQPVNKQTVVSKSSYIDPRTSLIKQLKKYENKCLKCSLFCIECIYKVIEIGNDGFIWEEWLEAGRYSTNKWQFSWKPILDINDKLIRNEWFAKTSNYRQSNPNAFICGDETEARDIYRILNSIYETY